MEDGGALSGAWCEAVLKGVGGIDAWSEEGVGASRVGDGVGDMGNGDGSSIA